MNDRLAAWISKVDPGEKSNAPVEGNTHIPGNIHSHSAQRSARKQFFTHRKKQHHEGHHKLRVIPLGGLNEVGRNCMALEYGNDIILVDAGFQFPEEHMYGVDYVLPDTRYVEEKKQNIRAILITHGHLDHIGGLRFILPRIGYPPVFAPPLAAGLIEKQLSEQKQVMERADIRKIDPTKDVLRFGGFTVEYFHVNHSIPDCNGLYIQTPTARIVHTGDFKFDFTPADGIQTEYVKIAKIGERGVDAVFADSTNAQKEGFCVSEKVVAETMERVIRETKHGRLFITSFSSLLARWQQVIRFAQKYNRKIYVTGRSLLENLRIATDLGFIKVPKGLIHRVSKRMNDTPSHQQLVISTGCQGEENAAIARIVRGEHDIIKVEKDDTIVFSSSPIPGNERQTINVINELYKLGARVITRDNLNVHTSGHGHQGDLKLMYSLLKPKNIIPIHGEFHMRADHAKMVRKDLGYHPDNIALLGNGDILEVHQGKIQKLREKASGEHILVDGNMVGDVGPEVLQARKELMNGGVLSFVFHIGSAKKELKNPPSLQGAGFAYPHEAKDLHNRLQKEAIRIFQEVITRHGEIKKHEGLIKKSLREKLAAKVLEVTEREPRILVAVIVD